MSVAPGAETVSDWVKDFFILGLCGGRCRHFMSPLEGTGVFENVISEIIKLAYVKINVNNYSDLSEKCLWLV